MCFLHCLRLGVFLGLVSFSLASDLKVGFAEFARESSGASPAASSLFSITNPEGILVSEAGVESSTLLNRGRIFVQQGQKAGTGIALANPSDSSLTLKLVLRDLNGQVIDRNDDVSMAPHHHVAKFVSELFEKAPVEFTGSLTFEVAGALNRVAAVTLRQSKNPYGEPLLTTLPVMNLDLPEGSAQSGEFIFPHLGAGPGFSTQLILINPAPLSTEGVIHLFSSDGKKLELQSGATTASSFPFVIAPDGTFFSEFVSPPGGGLGVGYARVQVTKGPLPSGSAIFRYTEAGKPLSEAGVGAPPRMRKARLFVDTRDTSSGFAVVNPNSTTLNLTLRLYDANGKLLSEKPHSLAPGNHLAQFAREAFQLTPRFVGLLEIEGNGSFVPVTLKLSRNSRRHSILTTLPVANVEAPNSDTLLVLPQVATGSSVIGEFLTRLIFIAPVQEQVVGGNLRFWQGMGEPLELSLLDGAMPYFIEGSGLGEIVFSDNLREAVLDKRDSVSAEIGSEGGVLVLEDCMGSRVSLSIPPYALLSSREVSMTCLGSRPVDTLGRNVFPGILLEPSGLLFRHPAELRLFFPEPIEDPKRSAIFTLGIDGIPRPASNHAAAGQFLVGEVRHFSEYWGDSANLADLLFWTETLLPAIQNPELQQKALEIFRNQMGFELDIETMESLQSLAELEPFAAFRRMTDDLGADLEKVPDPFRDFLELLAIDFITSPFPKNDCGHFHSFAIELGKLYSLTLGDNPDLNARIYELDALCVTPELSGWWTAQRSYQSETCDRYITAIKPGCDCGPAGRDVFRESDFVDPYRFLITQVGSNFTISFPEGSEAPFYIGTVEATGESSYPFYLRLTIPPEDSLECKTFFETKGSFKVGEAICVPASYNECEPVSCYDQEKLFAKVTGDGRILGESNWLIGATVIEWLEGCCDYITDISCSGSGPFVAVRD